jgi:hypothetical protein
MEERWVLVDDDDEIDGATFATVGSLVDFVGRQARGLAGLHPPGQRACFRQPQAFFPRP